MVEEGAAEEAEVEEGPAEEVEGVEGAEELPISVSRNHHRAFREFYR